MKKVLLEENEVEPKKCEADLLGLLKELEDARLVKIDGGSLSLSFLKGRFTSRVPLFFKQVMNGRQPLRLLSQNTARALELLHRILHKLAYIAPGGYSLRPWLHRKRGARIGKNVWISQYVYIDELHPEAVTIKDNVSIGLRSTIFTHFYWGSRRSSNGFSPVIIEKDVFIGPHCLILPGVRIGEGAVIRGGTLVSSDVPPFTFWGLPAAGPLARVTVPLTPDHTYDEFVKGLKPFRKKKPSE
jgi:acetyltransferase-like isoleucine patch superfamily enzyme